MRNAQNEVLSFTFQSRGYAFRIVGKGTQGPDLDDVRRQFMAEGVQGLNVTRLKQIHGDLQGRQALLPQAVLAYGPELRLEPVRHAVWRRLNRSVTRVNRLTDRLFAGEGPA